MTIRVEDQKVADLLGTQAEHRFRIRRAYERMQTARIEGTRNPDKFIAVDEGNVEGGSGRVFSVVLVLFIALSIYLTWRGNS